MDTPGESNTLAAAALFAASLVVDAFTARDAPEPEGTAATSLRASSIILVACLASPPIREWMLLEQRAVGAVLLAGVAFAGMHEGSTGQRVGDSIFIVLMYVAMLYMFWSGGVLKDIDGNRVYSVSADAPPFVRREMLMNVAVSTLLYSSLRLVRQAYDQPLAVSDYTHASTAFDGTQRELQGYAYSSSVGVSALCFGAAAGVGTAVAMFVTSELRTQGTAAATLLLTVSATAQLTSAFVTTLSQSEALDNLPAIWSTGACAVRELCPVAFDARRMSVINQSPSALWINGLGTFVLAYAPTLRMQSRTQMLGTQRNFEMVVYAMIGTTICVVALIAYLSFSGSEALTDYALVGAVISVFVTAFVDSLAGALSFVICLTGDIVTNWAADGSEGVFMHLARSYEMYIMLLLVSYTLLNLFVEVLWRVLPQEAIDATDRVLGVIVVAGTSAATALYLAAAASAASYDGQLLDETHLRGPDRRFARTSAAAAVEHWLPLLVWLPLYGCRCEVEFLSTRTRAIAWYVSGLVPVGMWFVALAVLEASPTRAVGWADSSAYLVNVAVVAVSPWLVLVWA